MGDCHVCGHSSLPTDPTRRHRRVRAPGDGRPSPGNATAAAPPADWAVTEWGFAPLVSRTPGFEAYYPVDAGQGVVVSISVRQ